jgi:hypothetical protein
MTHYRDDDQRRSAELDDDLLLERFRVIALEHDPVPAAVRRAAVGSLAWRTVDEELALLVADTADSAAGHALVRDAAEETRLLTFEATDLTVEVEVVDGPGGARRLIGQLVPPGPGQVQVQSPDGETAAEADEIGRFLADGVPAGQIRLRVTRAGEPPVTTSWTAV